MYFAKILIVDDNPEIHDILELHFEAYGRSVGQRYILIHADNGQEALNLLAENPGTDVIILDLEMPVMTGFEFLAKAREDLRFRSIPVFVFSSSSSDAANALKSGARDYVTKPGDFAEIMLRILNLIEGKQQAEAGEQTKVTFMTTVSHELRTPMNGVLGMTQLLRTTELSAEQAEYVEALEHSAHHMMTIVNDVFSFLQSENPLYYLPLTPFSVRETVQRSVEEMTSEAIMNHVTLTFDIHPNVPDNLIGLPDKLKLIFHHLISNGIKFSPSGIVSVHIEAGERDETNVQLCCSVADTGIGVPAEMQTLIFEPFTQGDGSSIRKFGGLGIGLSIASRIAQLMGSPLRIESSPGGSRFSFAVNCKIA
jgi:signal transduction histidine kinase